MLISLYDNKIMINLKTNYYVHSIYRTLLAEIWTLNRCSNTDFTQFLLLKYHKLLTKFKITSHTLRQGGYHKLNRITKFRCHASIATKSKALQPTLKPYILQVFKT